MATKTPGRCVGGVGAKREVAGAKNSSEMRRIEEGRAEEIRSAGGV